MLPFNFRKNNLTVDSAVALVACVGYDTEREPDIQRQLNTYDDIFKKNCAGIENETTVKEGDYVSAYQMEQIKNGYRAANG